MMVAVPMRSDYNGDELRKLAGATRDAAQARRLMSLAAVADGKSRGEAAIIGLMDRQTLRDWVNRFNAQGPEGLKDHKSTGRTPKLTSDQKHELCQLVEEGPKAHVPGLIRWRRSDLVEMVKARFGIDCHETTLGRMLKELGFSHISPRPQHPKQDPEIIEEFKKNFPSCWRKQ